MASWLVRTPPNLVMRVRAVAGDLTLSMLVDKLAMGYHHVQESAELYRFAFFSSV